MKHAGAKNTGELRPKKNAFRKKALILKLFGFYAVIWLICKTGLQKKDGGKRRKK
jgi:hypothetical protein